MAQILNLSQSRKTVKRRLKKSHVQQELEAQEERLRRRLTMRLWNCLIVKKRKNKLTMRKLINPLLWMTKKNKYITRYLLQYYQFSTGGDRERIVTNQFPNGSHKLPVIWQSLTCRKYQQTSPT